jgi:phage replication-related protein YjqB (UPF0714/DUF867 family)
VFAELLAHPGVEEQAELRSRVGFLALHGGLEEGTAEIARAAADRAGASWYSLVQPPDLRWHVPSHNIDPTVSPMLGDVLAHCDVVVSVHGFGRDGFWTSLLVGGADRDLAAALSSCLRAALPEYEVLDDLTAIPSGLRGLDPRNPVNRSRGGGVQLELPPRVRGMGPHWEGFAGPGFTPHSVALVDALAEFATRAAA